MADSLKQEPWMIFDLVIEGATVVSPHRTYQANVGVVGETIAAIDYAPMEGHESILARGKYLIPGVIDSDVHLPPSLKSGKVVEFLPWSDGYVSGSKSAAFGGVTTLLDIRFQ